MILQPCIVGPLLSLKERRAPSLAVERKHDSSGFGGADDKKGCGTGADRGSHTYVRPLFSDLKFARLLLL